MSNRPITDALNKRIEIPTDIPPDTVTITGEATQGGDAGIRVDANVDIGKPGGWDLGGQFAYWMSRGASAMGYLRWGKGKK